MRPTISTRGIGPRLLLAFVPLILGGHPAFGICEDDGSDDGGNLAANVGNSACVNGNARSNMEEVGGGGVNTPPMENVPTDGSGDPSLQRTISGNNAGEFLQGQPFNMPVTPGQEYKVNWTKIPTSSSVGSLHTQVTPENMPDGYHVEVNAGDGNGWQSGNKLDLAQAGIDTTTVDHRFRIVRPIREAGKVSSILLTRPLFVVNRGAISGGDTRPGVFGVDADTDTYLDTEIPSARFIMPLGAATEDDRPVTAGDLIFERELWTSGSFTVNRSFLSYEGVDRSKTGVVVKTDASGWIRQVRAPGIFVDAVTINGTKFELRLYGPASVAGQNPFGTNLYSPTGSPHAVWTVAYYTNNTGNFSHGVSVTEATDGSTVRSVQMQARRQGNNYYQTRRIEGSDTELLTSSVVAAPPGGFTVGGQTISFGSNLGTADTRDQTIEVFRNGATISKSFEKRTFVSSRVTGVVGMGEVVLYRDDWFGAGANDKLRTEYAFTWTDTWAGNFGGPVGKPLIEYYPDGSWERYQHNANGTLAKVYRPYEGLPASPWDATDTNCVVETLEYGGDPVAPLPGGAPAAMVTYEQTLPAGSETEILGVMVGKTVRTHSNQTVGGEPVLRTTIQDYYDDTNYVESHEEAYHETASQELRGLPRSSTSAAGEKITWTYDMGDFDASTRVFTPSATGMSRRETRTQGTTASPGGIAYKTTRTRKIMCLCGKMFQEETQVHTGGTSYETATVTDYYYDANHRRTEIRRDGRTILSAVYNGLTETRTDEEGAVFTIVKDLNGRVVSDAKASGPAATTVFNALTATTTIGSLTRSSTTDVLGRESSVTDTQGRTVSTTYPNSGRDRRTTYPGSAAVLETRQPGGRIVSVTNASGSRIVPRHYAYGVDSGDGRQWVRESEVTAANVRYRKITRDWLDREVTREMPAPSGTGTVTRSWSYGSHGLLAKASDSASVNLAPRIWEYDSLGMLFREGWDLGGTPNVLDLASTDAILEHDHSFEKNGGLWYEVREVKQYQQDGSATPATIRVTKVRMSSNADGYASEVIGIDAHGVVTTATQTIDRASKTVTTRTSRSDRTDESVQVAVNGLLTSRKTTADSLAEVFQYDSLERLWKTSNARNGSVTTRLYNAQGLLHTVTDEALPRTTTYEYYASNHANAGQIKRIINANNKSTWFEYNGRGQQIREWGDAAWPVEREFDSFGDLFKTRSYRSGSGWAAPAWPSGTTGPADTTTYQRTATTGLLDYIADAQDRRTEFTWKDNGSVHTRKWARSSGANRVTTTYIYDTSGTQIGRTYNDGITPSVSFTPDRAGRIRVVTDATGTRTMTHTTRGLTAGTSITGIGILSGVLIDPDHDLYGRHVGTSISVSGAPVYESTIDYDLASGRLLEVGMGDNEAEEYPSAQYLYRPNSDLIGEVLWKRGGVPVVGNLRTYDALDRLDDTKFFTGVSVGGPSLVASFDYELDFMNRRARTTHADGSWWDYGYNDRGELEVADKKLPSSTTPYAGQQYRQSHDHAGNRTGNETGGDAAGVNKRIFSSPQNTLNQASGLTTPATFDVVGRSPSAPTVTVNGSTSATVSSQGDYFRAEVTALNASGAAWTEVTVSQGTDSTTGHVLIAPASVTPTYDLDGNLESDGVWSYTWDAENRMIKAVRNLPGVPYREVRYAYDAFDRRVQRIVYHAPNSPPVSTERYLHEGARCLITLDGSNQPVQSYLWGLDVSRTMDNAEGVGGLLAIRDHATGETHFACSDGNGNVTTLVAASTGAVSANYEYGPFGDIIRATGPYAGANPFRFSTRCHDNVTGLLDYGARWYKPEWGRWLSRDPLGELDSPNLYRFVGNDPINSIDLGGKYSWEVWRDVLLSPNTYVDIASDPEYWDDVGQNFKDVGEGFVNGAKGTVDGVKSIPEIADFVASGEAAEMVDRLLNDPDFRDEMARHLGEEFCDFYNKLQTQEGFFETYGETAFGILSGAGAVKLIKAFKAAKAAGRFAKAADKIDDITPDMRRALGGCFVAGTLVLSADGLVAIEVIQPGDRVLASDADGANSWSEVDPATWRQVTLRMANPESLSEFLEVVALRPSDWLAAVEGRPGAVVALELEEMGISGAAEIVSIEPCPTIASGPGRVVLSTITHVNADVRVVRLSEGAGILELTGSHRLFSLDRGGWIATRDLKPGETLATHEGEAVIEGIERKPGEHRVFNIEVESEHCFYVGDARLLSHNTNPCAAEIFEIQDGVRRAKAADTLGKKSIDAEIVDEFDRVVDRKEVPVDSLRSPKDKIETRNLEEIERYGEVQDATQKGASLPPIRVTPGERGIPVRDVGFDYGR